MKASAPNWLVAGFQVFPKIPHPSALNHGAACWVVVTAIRTRITSTSRPAPSVMIWKVRSPNGRRWDRARVDPAVPAGSTCWVTVLMTTSRSDLCASRCPWRARLRAYFVELRLCLLVQARRQWCIVQPRQQFLAVPEQVADVGLEHLRGVRAPLLLEDQVPRLIGDRVRTGAGCPDGAERQVGLDRGVVSRGRGRLYGRRDVIAVLVLDGGVGQPGGLGVGEVHVPDGPGGGLDDLRHPAVAAAAPAGGGPGDG